MAHTPYGYQIENGKAVIDEIKAKQISILFKEYVSGSSLSTAGGKAGIELTHSSLGRMIDNIVYIGDEFYPPIVSEEIWSKAQKERERRVDALSRNKDKTSPFSGKIYCSHCGSEYRRYSRRGKEGWKCARHMMKGKMQCDSPSIPENCFEDAFMRIISMINISDLTIRTARQKSQIEKKYDDPFKQAEYAYLQTQIDDFDFQTEKLLDALQDIPAGFDGEFMKKVIKLIDVSHSGAATFVLINDKEFREELSVDEKP